MERMGMIFMALALWAITARAQQPKIEIAPYAGGYFSAGFQSVQVFQLAPAVTVREARPVDEPNSGIFGVRASYDLTRRFSLEGAFGFSPAGREISPSPFVIARTLPPATPLPAQETLIAALVPVVRGEDTFSYSGNVLLHWRNRNGWTPFLTAGLGAITRTAEIELRRGVPRPLLVVVPIPFNFAVTSPTETDFSVNFGGGVKKYFSNRCGIRIDFRNYTNELGEDTVNNMEVSLGIILRM